MVLKGGKVEKRQRTAALQNAAALSEVLVLPQGFGVRLSSAALLERTSPTADFFSV